MTISLHYFAGPVTALEIIGNYILAGVGDLVHIFSVADKCETQVVECLTNRNIHGLKINNHETEGILVCAFGAKCIRIMKSDNSDNCRCSMVTEVVELKNWIQDIQWLVDEIENDSSCIAVALSHNIVLLWNWKKNCVLKEVCCEEQCILYSALFIGNSWTNLLLAAGTVFNQVVLWPVDGETDNDNRCKVIHRLSGHKGVIFGVDYNREREEICTVSDDRSIQIWKISHLETTHDMSSIEKWTRCQISLKHSLYGHSARVWKGKILRNRLLSIGEDSTCCVWSEDGHILRKFKGHKGKSIWSLAVNNKETFMVTGGGDCSIRMWSISESCTDSTKSTTQRTLTVPETMMTGEDFPRIVSLRNYDTLFVMTNEGKLLTCCVHEEKWMCLMDDADFRSYSIMSISESGNFVAVGSITGSMMVFITDRQSKEVTSSTLLKIYDGKVFSINWLDDTSLATTGPDGLIILWSLDTDREIKTVRLDRICDFHLPKCKQRWLSTATYTSDRECLVCGDRGGTVHLYKIANQHLQTSELPLQSFPKLHGKAGVTDSCIYEDRVYTAGRDGQFREYIYNGMRLELLNSTKVLKGLEWIGRIQFIEDNLFIFGFQSSNFVMWNTNQNQKLLEVECGGGHRAWDCKIENGMARFVYLKTGSLIICDTEVVSNQTILKTGLHGREMCDVKFLTSLHLHASGIEHSGLKVLKSFASHIGSVRTMTICKSSLSADNTQSSLVFSAGGRAQMKVWRFTHRIRNHQKDLTENTSDISTLCDNWLSVTHEQLGSFMLGEKCKNSKPWKTGAVNSNPETRFMNLTAFSASEISQDERLYGIHFVAAACSDGFIRLFVFDERSKELMLLGLSEFHDHCVLKIRHIVHRIGCKSKIILLSAATDGILAFWDVTEQCQHYNFLYLNSSERCDICDRPKHHEFCMDRDLRCDEAFPLKQHKDVQHGGSDFTETPFQYAANKVSSTFEVGNIVTDSSSDKTKICEMTIPDELQTYGSSSASSNSFTNPEHGHHSAGKGDKLCECTRRKSLSNICDNYVETKCNFSSSVSVDTKYIPSDSYAQKTLLSSKKQSCGSKDVFIKATHTDKESSSSDLYPIYTVQCHQSGINSVHTMFISGNNYMVVSGGDDGALHILLIRITDNGIAVSNQGSRLDAHSAQITGIHMINVNEVLTASIDQRICIWKINVLTDEIQITMKSCKFVNVADISGIDCWMDKKTHLLAVCGIGLGILEIS